MTPASAALDALHDLPPDSRVAVLDTGEEGGDDVDDDWIGTPAQVRSRINGLRFRPVRAPLVPAIERAAAMLAKAGEDGDWAPSSRRLYVFSDRTKTSWAADAAKGIHLPEGVQAAFIDLGVDRPVNLSIDKVEVKPTVVPPGGEVTVHVEVRAVGGHFDANLLCQLDGAGSLATRHVETSAGSRAPAAFEFKLKAPALARPAEAPEGVVTEAHQIVVKFSGADDRPFVDDLPHDNIRYATFFVRDDLKRPGRRVLVLEDDPDPAGELKKKPGLFWYAALEAYQASHSEGYHCDLRPAADAAKLSLKDLEPYRVVCLYQLAKPIPVNEHHDFYKVLEEYVNGGGGLAIVPPTAPLMGDDLKRWNDALDTHNLLPARLRDLTSAPEGKPVYWQDFRDNHPLTKPFYDWQRGANPDFADETLRPFVKRYWEVDLDKDKSLIVSTYRDDKNTPALVELKRGAGGQGGEARPCSSLHHPAQPPTRGSFRSGLEQFLRRLLRYGPHQRGVQVPGRRFVDGGPQLHLRRPGRSAAAGVRAPRRLPAERAEQDLTESERSITVDPKDKTLEVRGASAPGAYSVFDPNRNLFTAFSLNVSPDESRLDRVPAEEIEKALGPGSVLTAQPGVSLNGPLRERAAAATTAEPPWEPLPLLPLLMILTLLFLTFEGLLANRFYERPSSAAAGGPEGEQTPS